MAINLQAPAPPNGQSWSNVLSPIAQILAGKVEQHRQQQQQMQQSQTLNQLLQPQQGQDLSDPMAFLRQLSQAEAQGVSPQLTESYKQMIPKLSESKRKSEESAFKRQEELAPYKQGLQILERQRELLKKGNLGPKLGGVGQSPKLLSTLGAQGQKDRAEYERLGKALISMASNIPIRNRQEFETLAHDLYDPTKKEAEIEGILDAMERIIKGNLGGEEGGIPGNPEVLGRSQSSKPQGDFVLARHKKTGKQYKIPRAEYQDHPDLEVSNQ